MGGKTADNAAATIKLPMVVDEQDNQWQIAFTD